MNNHICDASLKELSALLNYSLPYASTLIVKIFGKTFSEILLDVRCEAAAELLTKTELPVKMIIRSVGYDNESFFRRSFKARYGLTPLKYRKLAIR